MAAGETVGDRARGVLVPIDLGDARAVDEAYRAAEAAQPAWAATLPQERRDVLDRAAAIMERRKQEIVDWLVRESGSTRRLAPGRRPG